MRPRVESQVFPSYRLDRKALELDTAKEILREVFGTTPAEVEEMIRLRLAELEMRQTMLGELSEIYPNIFANLFSFRLNSASPGKSFVAFIFFTNDMYGHSLFSIFMFIKLKSLP